MRHGKFFLPLALVLSTTTLSAQTRFFQRAGDAKSTDFGAAVAGVGDVDADGFVDFAVGAPGDDGAGFDSGMVRVFSGYDGSELLTLRGGAPADHFGFALAAVGDYDLDGYADLAVGSPEAHDGPLDDCGVVQVLDGTNGFELRRLVGAASHDNLGWSLGSVGDLTGDGFSELAVGVPGDDRAGNAAGRVSVHDLRAGSVAYSWLGGAPQDRFGTAVAGAGDVDRDGVFDVVVGVEHDDPNGSDSGAAYVLSGSSGEEVFVWFGDASGEKTGAAVAGLGDVNGDGYGEVAVGAPFAKNGGTARYGRVRVHSGKDGNAIHTWFGDSASDRFGWAVSGLGDIEVRRHVVRCVGHGEFRGAVRRASAPHPNLLPFDASRRGLEKCEAHLRGCGELAVSRSKGAKAPRWGMSVPLACLQWGVQRGGAPLPGAWGCPPSLVLSPPSWQEGGRGMVETAVRSHRPRKGNEGPWQDRIREGPDLTGQRRPPPPRACKIARSRSGRPIARRPIAHQEEPRCG